MSQKELDAMTDKVLAYNPNKPNGDSPLETIAGAADSPLKIGDVELPCYVLADETRVITRRGLFTGIGADNRGGGEMPEFFTQNWLSPFINNDLAVVVKSPIPFVPSHGGQLAYGYPATVLADICDAILEADRQGATTSRQKGIVDRAVVLLQGFARVGIVALVDEATGYEDIREERALAKILELYVAKELQQWTKTFPMEFYEQICRLWGWDSIHAQYNRRPSVVGKITNDVVYERLAPGVLSDLQSKNPTLPSGYRRDKHHQWLTPDLGHPALREHLAGVIALMKNASSRHVFMRSLDRVYPKTGAYQPPRKKPMATLEKFFPKKD